ncbi:MAG: hypothetical protein AAB463_00405 [Patescibacteria group bacterium]
MTMRTVVLAVVLALSPFIVGCGEEEKEAPKSGCPEKGCRDYAGLTSAKDGGMVPVNDGEALVMLADRLARREKIHQIEIDAIARREEANRDAGIAAYERKRMEVNAERMDAAEDREAIIRAAEARGAASARRNPCGSAAWRPCNP